MITKTDLQHSHVRSISYVGNLVNCWETLRAFVATTRSATTIVKAKKTKDWAISSQAASIEVDGSTTIETTLKRAKGVEYTPSGVEAPGRLYIRRKIWSNLHRDMQLLVDLIGVVWYSPLKMSNLLVETCMRKNSIEVTAELLERFHEKWVLNKESGCWEWVASLSGSGYGQIKIPGTRKQAHAQRLSYIIHYGEIPDGMLICHTCDNRLCVKPSHLFAGTYKDNSEDMVSKGRSAFGEKQGSSKLTEDMVLAIYKMADEGMSQNKIANTFKIAQTTVWKILHGLRWAYLYKSTGRDEINDLVQI